VGAKLRLRRHQSLQPESLSAATRSAKSILMLLMAELEEKISVNENGCSRTLTKRHALAKQLVNKAVMGDFCAFRCLSELVRPEEQRREERVAAGQNGNSAQDRVSRRIEEMAARVLARHQQVAASDTVGLAKSAPPPGQS
jgi:hypothetical protein